MLTEAMEDYLKAIYKLHRGKPVQNSAVADELGVSPASVTAMIKHLARLGLVRNVPYQGFELTPSGEKSALGVIRHHRLVELYLAEKLGYSWDEVHAEADRLEHVISPALEDRMAEALGQSAEDPHGDPIPSKDGAVDEASYRSLAEVEVRDSVVIRRVSDASSERLRYLGQLGLVPSAEVQVIAVEPFGGPIVVQVGGERYALGRELASTIRVSQV